MPEADRRKLVDHCLLHLVCFKKACKLGRGRMLPKHHLWYHLTVGTPKCSREHELKGCEIETVQVGASSLNFLWCSWFLFVVSRLPTEFPTLHSRPLFGVSVFVAVFSTAAVTLPERRTTWRCFCRHKPPCDSFVRLCFCSGGDQQEYLEPGSGREPRQPEILSHVC